MSNVTRQVDGYISKNRRWQPELEALRALALGCGLAEEIKWMSPCYTLEGRNIVLLHCFKAYCAMLFFKGALLKDAQGLLVQQTENVQGARQLRFTSVEEVKKLEQVIRAYVLEAIGVEKSGAKVALKPTAEFAMPEEFQARLAKNKALKAAFEKLTPGRQRGYLLHFAGAKQASTRAARVEKCIPEIMAGRGLND